MKIRPFNMLSPDMHRAHQQLQQLLDEHLPDEIESELRQLVVSSFESESYQGNRSGKWAPRCAGTRRNQGRKLLVDSGDLIKSYDTEKNGRDISIGSDLVYAQVHNEGLRAGSGAGFQMPRRQHMPEPGEPVRELEEAIGRWLDKKMSEIFD